MKEVLVLIALRLFLEWGLRVRNTDIVREVRICRIQIFILCWRVKPSLLVSITSPHFTAVVPKLGGPNKTLLSWTSVPESISFLRSDTVKVIYYEDNPDVNSHVMLWPWQGSGFQTATWKYIACCFLMFYIFFIKPRHEKILGTLKAHGIFPHAVILTVHIEVQTNG